jgi:thiamine biosynthesis lipoprotein
MTFTGFRLVHLDSDRIIKADGRLRLDCNGIAQGYTVDVISGFLAAQGVEHFLVEVGGEVFAKNTKPDGSPWKVGIEKPDGSGMHAGGELVTVKLRDRALSTSGNYRKYFIHNGRKYSHTMNPQTGFPAMNNLLSATVCAADCLSADAYATAFMVMGLDKASAFLQRHPELSAYLIYADENGNVQVYMTQAFREMLAKTGAEP